MQQKRHWQKLSDTGGSRGLYIGLDAWRDAVRSKRALPSDIAVTSCQQPPILALKRNVHGHISSTAREKTTSFGGRTSRRALIQNAFKKTKGVLQTLRLLKKYKLLGNVFKGYRIRSPYKRPNTPLDANRLASNLINRYSGKKAFIVGFVGEEATHAFLGSFSHKIKGAPHIGVVSEVHWGYNEKSKNIFEFHTFRNFFNKNQTLIHYWVFEKR